MSEPNTSKISEKSEMEIWDSIVESIIPIEKKIRLLKRLNQQKILKQTDVADYFKKATNTPENETS